MKNISISRLTEQDLLSVVDFFRYTITDTYIKDGIDVSDEGDLNELIEKKKDHLNDDLSTNGSKRIFFLAKSDTKIIGTISSATPTDSEQIIKLLSGIDLSDVADICDVYILPEYQGKGVGTLLFNAMLLYLLGKGVKRFSLDSGYKLAVKYWTSRLGEPTRFFEDYWGKGEHQAVWVKDIVDVQLSYKVA